LNSKLPFYPRIIPLGETAFTVEFGDTVDMALNGLVHVLDADLQAHPIFGITEVVPTYRSLLVMYDPCRIDPLELQIRLLTLAERLAVADSASSAFSGHLVEIPVRYGGEWGPDLLDVAAHTHFSPESVIQRHCEPTYLVAMLGFAPGFAYLLGLPSELSTPRLATPRLHVPPGSVGIAGSQTGLYALDTPGGWRIIGRTLCKLFDPEREQPFLLQTGDRIRFIAEE
jgi:KipI family sensor histidine kinase inhibitor